MKYLTPKPEDLSLLREDLEIFRDAGCRLLVPQHTQENLLVTRLSGHLLIAPSERGNLGFSFSEKSRISSAPLPTIHTNPYNPSSDIMVHIGHNDYFIYPTFAFLQSERSMGAKQDMYVIPVQWMLDTQALKGI